MGPALTVRLGGHEYEAARARLGGFLALQGASERVVEAVQAQDTGAIAEALFGYLKAAIPALTRNDFESADWFEVIAAYRGIESLNRIPDHEKFGILRRHDRKGRSVAWDYPGRGAYFWVHMIARAYGWSKNEIENLWPEDAVGLLQEILADDQLDREFLHSLSEVAYEYNKSTKKSKLKPLPRPAWMVLSVKTRRITRQKILRSSLPVGNIVYPDDAPDELRLN